MTHTIAFCFRTPVLRCTPPWRLHSVVCRNRVTETLRCTWCLVAPSAVFRVVVRRLFNKNATQTAPIFPPSRAVPVARPLPLARFACIVPSCREAFPHTQQPTNDTVLKFADAYTFRPPFLMQPDGAYTCSPFHVRFGKLSVWSPAEKVVSSNSLLHCSRR